MIDYNNYVKIWKDSRIYDENIQVIYCLLPLLLSILRKKVNLLHFSVYQNEGVSLYALKLAKQVKTFNTFLYIKMKAFRCTHLNWQKSRYICTKDSIKGNKAM